MAEGKETARRKTAEPKTAEPKAPKAETLRKTTSKSQTGTPAKTAAKSKPAAKAPAVRKSATAGTATRSARASSTGKATASRARRKQEAGGAGSLQVGVFNGEGARSGEVELPRAIFGQVPNQAVMHQALLRQLANARQGTAATKTRGMVSGGGAKPYRQKGTGRARHGSEREPSMVGGGTVFGPHPRSYRQEMPRQMRRLALRSALSVKVQEGKVSVVEAFQIETPKTRQMVELLRGMGVEDTALVVLPTPNLTVSRSVANLPWAKAVLAGNLSLYDLMTHDHLVIAREALATLEETFSAPSRSKRRQAAEEPRA